MASITFINERKTLDALPGANLRDLALRSGIPLYKTFQRIFHINFKLGPLNIFSASDVVEVEGKGVNNRSDAEVKALEGRFLPRYKLTPNLRIASQVVITGDASVKTFVVRELDKKMTKEQLGYFAVLAGFALVMVFMVALVGLDLVKKM
jgi:hypothetical protein